MSTPAPPKKPATQTRRDTGHHPSPAEAEIRWMQGGTRLEPTLPRVNGPVPQFDLSAEQVTLGKCITAPEWLAYAIDRLLPRDFYAPQHMVIFEAIHALATANRGVDQNTVRAWLINHDKLHAAGGMEYIAQCVAAPPQDSCTATIELVESLSRIRRIQGEAHRIASEGYGCVEDAQAYADKSAAMLNDIAMERGAQRPENLAIVGKRRMEALKKRIAGEEDTSNPNTWTGMPALDRVLGPLTPSLTLVGAWSGVGKSSLMREWAFRVASQRQRRRGVVIISLEMTTDEMADALAYRIGGVDSSKLNNPELLTTGDAEGLSQAFAWKERHPWVWILDRSDLATCTPKEIEAIVRQIQNDEAAKLGVEVGMVLVDYLQLANGREGLSKQANREQEVANIAYGLQQASQRRKTAFVAGTQLNEDGKKRKDGRPCAEDTRESRGINQAAHRIILIHNPHYLERRRKMQEDRAGYVAPDSEDAELIVDKNRGGGRTGIVPVKFLPWCTAFSDPADPQGPQ